MFSTHLDTTADSGTTIEYIDNISSSDIKKLRHFDFRYKYLYCRAVVTKTDTYEILTHGMNDTESRNSDGSYKWEEYFNELAGLE